MERYPAIENGRVTRWLVDSTEFTGVNGDKYMWIDNRVAKRINKFIKWPVLEIAGERLNFPRFFEDIPWPYVSVAWDLKEYVDWFRKKVPQGMKVILNFSGGKDSIAAAKVLVEAGAEVTLLYSHVTFLENPKNMDFVERVANKLGARLIKVEADKEIMKNMLEKGMPFRGNRWCTTQKVKPLKKVLKDFKDYVRADGERMFESIKRFKRLSFHSPKEPKVFDYKRVKPIFLLTLIDVVKIVRDEGAVHWDYLRGIPRVACTFCPYKTLHEFDESVWKEVEDPGLIEEAIKASYKRLEYDVPFEDFFKMHLWRFSPKLADTLYKMKRYLEKIDEESIERNFVRRSYSSLWEEELPRPHIFRPEEGYRLFVRLLKAIYERSVEGFRKAEEIIGTQT